MANQTTVKVTIYRDDVMAAVGSVKRASMKDIALAAQAEARRNIERNKQIDTRFLLNSIYAIWRDGDTYNDTWPTGRYYSSKRRNQRLRREVAARIGLPPGVDATVASAAPYAIYPESDRSFLYAAVQQILSAVDQIVSQAGRRFIGR